MSTEETEVINATINQHEMEQPKWFIDEGVAGAGERPGWLPDKFKTAADMAKSFHELEKKLGQSPEEYDISRSKFLDKDYVPIKEALQFARDKRVPKDVIDNFVDSIDKYMDEFSTDYEAEAKKLGENATERLTVLDNWAKANLSNDGYNALTSNLKSADAIKALEELRGKMMSNNTVVPSGNDASATNVATLDDLRIELSTNLEKYKVDPKYRDDLRRRMEIASKSSNYVDKSGS